MGHIKKIEICTNCEILQGLVDYEGDSDEEEDDSELSPSPKRQRMS